MKEESPKLNTAQMMEIGEELLPVETLKGSLELSERGNPRATIANYVMILKQDPKLAGAICMNELTERIDIVKDMDWKRDGSVLTDTDMAYITLYIEENYGINCSKALEHAISVVSNENRYHPIRDILNSLTWDGIPRVENMLTHFFGVEKTELTTEALKIFMLGAVSRVFNPGCKFETYICITGEQGAGKSTFFKFLAIKDEFFSDDIKKLDDDKIVVRLQGHWILEMPEMLAVINTRNEETKGFISREKDTYRTPYDKHPRDRKRQCVFGGTSNKLEVLPVDKSGNRRIIPIETDMDKAEVHIMDNEAESRAYILQAWAEIMMIYSSGNFSLTLPDHLVAELAKYQQRFTPEDTDEEAVTDFLEKTKEPLVCVMMLAHEALGYSKYDHISKSDRNRIAEILHHTSGWEYVGTRSVVGYGRARAWKRKPSAVQTKEIPTESFEQLEIPFD